MKYRPTIAEPGAPLSASALNELSAEIRRLGGGTIQGGTQDGNNFNPDQSKGFYAKITSVGTGGWHSWQMVKWNSATAAWIDPPAPAAKGHKDTNGAFDPNGNSSAVDDIVWLEPLGVRKVSTNYWPAYAIKAGAGSSSSPFSDGTFVFLRYNGGGFDTYTSSGATTFDTLTPNGSGGFTTGTATVRNKETGPLFHGARSLDRTSWAPVPVPANSACIMGIRASSSDTVLYYTSPTFFYPARFRRGAQLAYAPTDPWREVEFCLRTPGALSDSGSWFLLNKDPGNYGAVGRMIPHRYYISTLGSFGAGSYALREDLYSGVNFDIGDFASPIWGILGNTQGSTQIDGTVGYSPDAGWFAASVAVGAKPALEGSVSNKGSVLVMKNTIAQNVYGNGNFLF